MAPAQDMSLQPTVQDGSSIRQRFRKGQAQANIIAHLKANSEFRASIKDAKASAFLYDKTSEGRRRFRKRTHDAFIAFVRIMAAEDGLPIGSTDSQVHQWVFHKSRILEYTCQYIKFLALGQRISPTGRADKKIKASTIEAIAAAIWFFAQWELSKDALAVFSEWHLYVPALIHKLAVEEGLGTSLRPKEYFGLPELRLFFLRLTKEPASMAWWKQHYVCWAVSCIMGARPSSLCVVANGKEKGNDSAETLRFKDIEFVNDFEELAVLITLRFAKGRRDPHTSRPHRPAKFLIKSCTKPENLHADLPWLLFVLAYERGLFGKTPWQDVLKSPSSRLVHDPVVTNQPVFVSCDRTTYSLKPEEPIYAGRLNPPLQEAARDVNLNVHVSMYVWRRECLTSIARNASVDIAKQVALHSDPHGYVFSQYDYGLGDMDLGQIRLGEFDDMHGLANDFATVQRLRNETRLHLSAPAIVSIQEYSKSDEKAYVKYHEEQRTDITARRSTRAIILKLIHEKFQLPISVPLSYPGILHSLKNLNKGADSARSGIGASDSPIDDDDVWIEAFMVASTPAEVISLLKGFRRAHLSHIKWVQDGLQKEFRDAWLSTKAPTSKEEVKQRVNKTKEPITNSLQLLSSAVHSNKNGRSSKSKEVNDRNAVLGSALGKWDGIIQNLDEDIQVISEVDDDIKVEDQDPLRTLVNSFPDGEDILVDVGELEGVSEQVDQTVTGQRMELIKLWLSWNDQYRGRQDCPLCQADVSGRAPEDCRHARYGSAHYHMKHTNYDRSYLPDNYPAFKRVLHAPTASGRTGAGIPWACRLCQRRFRIQGDMIEHYREDHAELCDIM